MKKYAFSSLIALSLISACDQSIEYSGRQAPTQGATNTQTHPMQTPQPIINTYIPSIDAIVVDQQATPPVSECYKADPFICEVELAIWRQTNEYRKKSGRANLTFGPKMGFVSRSWSASQAKRGSIGHDGFPSSRYTVYSKEFPEEPRIRMSTENVAYSGSRSQNAEAVAKVFTNMWWNSSGHRANMLGNHKAIGIGVVKRGSSTYYATQIFGNE